MNIVIVTLFPEYFSSLLETSILKRAQEKNLVSIQVVNIRDYAEGIHKITDERPFGGGPGMVLKVAPIHKALLALGYSKGTPGQHIALTSAKGKKFDQTTALEYAQLENLVIICGHYEGVDERVAQHLVDSEVRIGDYVLTGGEPAAGVIIDAVTRLLPGVLGNQESNKDESHSSSGKLAAPVYTRPSEYNNWSVPEVLLSGDHQQIALWRKNQELQEEG